MNEYYNWLINIIDDGTAQNHKGLLHEMMMKEFYSIVDGDDNREYEGQELRGTFADEFDGAVDGIHGPCSVLEMLVALAIRIDRDIQPDMDYDHTAEWFWLMIGNLGLLKQTDDAIDYEEIDHILDRWLERDYEFSGEGGLFPLEYAEKDQRDVEIWYQMHAYLMENYEV